MQEVSLLQPAYHAIGWCQRQSHPNSKLFTDDAKACILVHITFGCNQWEKVQDAREETI